MKIFIDLFRKNLFKNISYLFIFQIAMYLVPMVTLPYLTRTLGVAHFGVMGIALGIVSLMTLLTDWGFSWTATQDVARNAGNPEMLHTIFWDTFWARMGLGVLAFLILFIVTSFSLVPSVGMLGGVLLAASTQTLTAMLSVNWFLQGLERMGAFVTTLMAGRLLTIPLTFLLVRTPEDVAMAALIPGLCGIFSCAISFVVANRLVRLLPLRFNIAGSLKQLRAGAKIFLSTGAINLYTQSNVLIIGMLAGNAEAGLFHGGDRIRRAVQMLVGPIGTAIFPRINNLLMHDRAAAHKLMMMTLIGQGGLTFLLSIIMFFVAPWGVPFALGKEFIHAVAVVEWLSPIPFLVGISNVLGINIMLPLGMKNAFTLIVMASAAINFLLMLILCPRYGAAGGAAAATLAEAFVTGAMSVVLLYSRNMRRISDTKHDER